MDFSIIHDLRPNKFVPGTIDGSWIQDHHAGTLESAIAVAEATSKVNSDQMFAVVAKGTAYHLSPEMIQKKPLAIVGTRNRRGFSHQSLMG